MELDERDPLASVREQFLLPEGIIYLDGNSLGPLSKGAASKLRDVADREWGTGLVGSWNTAGWIDAPLRLGKKLAPLLGAAPEEVAVSDSLSINLFKLLVAALRMRPERRVIVTERENFPSDLYIMQSVIRLFPGVEVRRVPALQMCDAIDSETAVVCSTHVDFKTARKLDMPGITEQAHRHEALVLWNLAHSAGAVPLSLSAWNVDFAVGCGYKYLNGGPGAPAFCYVASRHQAEVDQPLTGWLGHADPFAFSLEYEAAAGVARTICGTPPILAFAPLEASLEIWSRLDLNLVWQKGEAMTELLRRLLQQDPALGALEILTPGAAIRRGSHVAVAHPGSYAIMRALIDRNVIGDFRDPDVMRLAITPLYLRFTELWDAVATLSAVMTAGTWRESRYQQRTRVT